MFLGFCAVLFKASKVVKKKESAKIFKFLHHSRNAYNYLSSKNLLPDSIVAG